jgi:hypothetical protein
VGDCRRECETGRGEYHGALQLKALLDKAIKSNPGPGAKADPKKTAAMIHDFMTKFAPMMAEMEAIFKMKAEVDAKFKKPADKGMNLLTPFLQQVDAAHKLGFNPDNSLQGDLDGRITEVFDLMKELKQYGSEVQWG